MKTRKGLAWTSRDDHPQPSWRSGPAGRAQGLMVLLGVFYTCAVLWVTLRPIAWAGGGAEYAGGILNPQAWIDPSAWTEGRPLEVVLNILMFVPIGVTAGLLRKGVAGMAGPLILTLTIELAQIPLDRISHPRDLVANATGALVGIIVITTHRRKNRRSSQPQGNSLTHPASLSVGL